ncbi:MAG: DUF2089 domain-containing protein [Clostridiales bacterium]|jgi:hypothetical protein|nr:DUF2089 domain-containing protein [Clostridiales bacterium]
MKDIVSHCPVCKHEMRITKLTCPECKTELSKEFPLNRYALLSGEQISFLECFLKNEGNYNAVRTERNITYQTAKNTLGDILIKLNLRSANAQEFEKVDVSKIQTVNYSKKASDIIRNLLVLNDGTATVISQSYDSSYRIKLVNNGAEFYCKALRSNPNYNLSVFDTIVDLLLEQGGKARKGNGRKDTVGNGECTYDTVVGRLGKDYFHKQDGEYTLDPVMVLTAILLWAGICTPVRGYLELSGRYKKFLSEDMTKDFND